MNKEPSWISKFDSITRIKFSISSLIVGWLCGAYFSEHVGFSLGETDFTSVWTYVWLFLWIPALIVKGVLYALPVVLIVLLYILIALIALAVVLGFFKLGRVINRVARKTR